MDGLSTTHYKARPPQAAKKGKQAQKPMPNITIIANPIAGGGKGREAARALQSSLSARGHQVRLSMTTAAGDAGRFSQQAETDADAILAIGGDGTLNEILNGLADPASVALGLLPMGTANILARELKLPWSVEGLADLVDQNQTRRIDVGLANDRRFVAVVSAGYDAAVIHTVHANRAGPLGFLGYIGPVLKTLREYAHRSIEIVADGQAYRGELIIVSNIRHYAGPFYACPDASPESGRLHLCIYQKADLIRFASDLVRTRLNPARDRGSIQTLAVHEVELIGPTDTPVEMDGDDFNHLPVKMSILPKACRMLAPGGDG